MKTSKDCKSISFFTRRRELLRSVLLLIHRRRQAAHKYRDFLLYKVFCLTKNLPLQCTTRTALRNPNRFPPKTFWIRVLLGFLRVYFVRMRNGGGCLEATRHPRHRNRLSTRKITHHVPAGEERKSLNFLGTTASPAGCDVVKF